MVGHACAREGLTAAVLRQVLTKYGSVEEVLLDPYKHEAFVTFVDATSARTLVGARTAAIHAELQPAHPSFFPKPKPTTLRNRWARR